MCGKEVQSLKGAELADYRGKQIGYLFQNFELLDNLTGRENISFPCLFIMFPKRKQQEDYGNCFVFGNYRCIGQISVSNVRWAKAESCSCQSGNSKSKYYSGDEPTGALDSKNAKLLMKKLSGLNQEYNATILMVTMTAMRQATASEFCSFRTE